jgi:hypothetical protein
MASSLLGLQKQGDAVKGFAAQRIKVALQEAHLVRRVAL